MLLRYVDPRDNRCVPGRPGFSDNSEDKYELGHTCPNIGQIVNEAPVHQRFEITKIREEA